MIIDAIRSCKGLLESELDHLTRTYGNLISCKCLSDNELSLQHQRSDDCPYCLWGERVGISLAYIVCLSPIRSPYSHPHSQSKTHKSPILSPSFSLCLYGEIREKKPPTRLYVPICPHLRSLPSSCCRCPLWLYIPCQHMHFEPLSAFCLEETHFSVPRT